MPVFIRGNKEINMAKEKVFALPNVATPGQPVTITDKCKGCNQCVEVCQVDVFIPSTEKGKAPLVLHPEECWYCGCCVDACKIPGAIKFNWPLQNRGFFKRKATGEVFQV
jgi:NAD-dependent dihydropyrimidine dehydrogenase PreA subunit